MKVLSLFDGMACGMLAMQRAGIEVKRYVAYEIDKYAIKTSAHNFPIIEHRGDVFQADFTEFLDFDFLIGGSPCTYWSIAQKTNRETEASGMGWELFSQYVRALHEAKPKFFVYENNKSMAKAILESITQEFGFEPVCINSALVSAQNRQRLYWVGKLNKDGTYSKVDIEQPEDRGILLGDVLDTTEDTKFCKGVSYERIGRNSEHGRHYEIEPNNKAFCLCAKGDRYYCCEAVSIGFRNRREANGKLYRRYETSAEKKANALTTVKTDSMVCVPHQIKDGHTTAVLGGMITIKGKQFPIKLPDGEYIFRHYSLDERKRLQTVPGWYEFPVSNTQAFKMLGNGWTVEVIAHIFTHILKEGENVVDNYSLWARHDAEQELALTLLPQCVCCGEPIQDEHCFDINGELYCEACLEETFRRYTEDYIKEKYA